MNTKPIIRHFETKDVARLLNMMKQLATFEGYIADFKVTEAYLLRHGLGEDRQFNVMIAEVDGEPMGYICYYTVAFTYHLKPKMILKELFIAKKARALGLGGLLFEALKTEAQNQDCCQIEWTVLPENSSAQNFYIKHGGTHDAKWQLWSLNC